MTMLEISFRQATTVESDSVAAIAGKSRAFFLPYQPNLHSFEDDKKYFRKQVILECEVWIVEESQNSVGFCALKVGWVEHLYLLPTHVGKTLGEALLNRAKENHPYLQLWAFQRNSRAISFYE